MISRSPLKLREWPRKFVASSKDDSYRTQLAALLTDAITMGNPKALLELQKSTESFLWERIACTSRNLSIILDVTQLKHAYHKSDLVDVLATLQNKDHYEKILKIQTSIETANASVLLKTLEFCPMISDRATSAVNEGSAPGEYYIKVLDSN